MTRQPPQPPEPDSAANAREDGGPLSDAASGRGASLRGSPPRDPVHQDRTVPDGSEERGDRRRASAASPSGRPSPAAKERAANLADLINAGWDVRSERRDDGVTVIATRDGETRSVTAFTFGLAAARLVDEITRPDAAL